MVDATCAQCERAPAAVLCTDEALRFCRACSDALHAKAARRHHRVLPLLARPPPGCDECESAPAVVQCAQCGGGAGQPPLRFCAACDGSLHARAARSHHVREPVVVAGGPPRRGVVSPGPGPAAALAAAAAAANLWRPGGDVVLQNARQPGGGGGGGAGAGVRVQAGTKRSAVDAGVVVKQEAEDGRQGKDNGGGGGLVAGGARGDEQGRAMVGGAAVAGSSSGGGGKKKKVVQGSSENGEEQQDQKPSRPPLPPPTQKRGGHGDGDPPGAVHNKRRMTGDDAQPSATAVKKEEGGAGPGNAAQPRSNKAFWHPNPQDDGPSDLSEECSSVDGGDDDDDAAASDIASPGDEEDDGIHLIKRGSVSLEAFVVNADHEADAEHMHPGKEQENAATDGVKDRIKKMLKLGLHPDTPEAEAQQALKNAQRLLTKYNLQQAEVMKGALKDPAALVGGMRVVELRGKGRAKVGRFERWIKSLAWVIADNFDAQHFTRRSSKAVQVVFYGIAQNADCAGYAFAATFNRITKMSAAYTDPEAGGRGSAASKRSTNTRVARMSYRDGVVEGLRQFVKQSQDQRRGGWAPKKGAAAAGADDSEGASDSSGGGGEEESDADNNLGASQQEEGGGGKSGIIGKEEKQRAKVAWQQRAAEKRAERGMAISALVVHSQKVGADFLKEKGIKLNVKSVKPRKVLVNVEAYTKGKQDSHQIDINQRAIGSAAGTTGNKPAEKKPAKKPKR